MAGMFLEAWGGDLGTGGWEAQHEQSTGRFGGLPPLFFVLIFME